MIRRRASRTATGTFILVSWIGIAVLGYAPSAGSATTSPSYSATGVCVAGVPEFAFSFTGFPIGQSTPVNLDLYDGPDAAGMQARKGLGLQDGPSVAQTGAGEPDALEQLRKLGELRASGVLTDAEFETKKAELLRRI